MRGILSAWFKTRHTAKTLVKHPDFRIVLIALKSGTRIGKHRERVLAIGGQQVNLRVKEEAKPGLAIAQTRHPASHRLGLLQVGFLDESLRFLRNIVRRAAFR